MCLSPADFILCRTQFYHTSLLGKKGARAPVQQQQGMSAPRVCQWTVIQMKYPHGKIRVNVHSRK